MGRMVIPAIWDVFWDPTDVLRTLVRAPNTLSQKNRHPKKSFLAYFRPIFSVRKIGQKSTQKEGKNVWTKFELFFQFFFQTMICSQNVLQTQGFQTLTSDFQYRTYSWRFFNFWKFYLFFIILNLKCVQYSIVGRDVRSTDIPKPKLGPKRYDKIGHFPYRTR